MPSTCPRAPMLCIDDTKTVSLTATGAWRTLTRLGKHAFLHLASEAAYIVGEICLSFHLCVGLGLRCVCVCVWVCAGRARDLFRNVCCCCQCPAEGSADDTNSMDGPHAAQCPEAMPTCVGRPEEARRSYSVTLCVRERANLGYY